LEILTASIIAFLANVDGPCGFSFEPNRIMPLSKFELFKAAGLIPNEVLDVLAKSALEKEKAAIAKADCFKSCLRSILAVLR
jgi:hypothetical protein